MPKLLVTAVLFWLGAVQVQFLPHLLPWNAILCFVLVGLFAFCSNKWTVLTAFIAGLLLSNGCAYVEMKRSLPESLYSMDFIIDGWVVGLPARSDSALRFDFRVDHFLHAAPRAAEDTRLRLSWYGKAAQLRPGERWRLKVRLRPPRGYRNWNIADREHRLFVQRIAATGYVQDGPDNFRQHSSVRVAVLDQIRWRLSRFIADQHPHSVASAVVRALAVGDRQSIDNDEWRIFRRTGLSHLMAISGLHIGLAAAFGFWIGNALWRLSPWLVMRMPAQSAARITSLVTAACYAALAGFSIPTVRALVTLGIVLLMFARNRRWSSSTIFSLALIAGTIWDPLSVSRPSFCLSYTAVGLIMIVNSRVTSSRQPLPAISMVQRFVSVLRHWLAIQIALCVGLAGLSMAFFGEVSLVSPLANLIIVPVFVFVIVPLVLAAAIVQLLGAAVLPECLIAIVVWIFELLWPLIEWLGTLPLSATSGLAASVCFAVATLITGVYFVRGRHRLIAIIGSIGAAAIVVAVHAAPRQALTVTVLDVGQGLAVVVETAHHSLLFDAGPAYGDFSLGEVIVVPYLRQRLISSLDMIIVSHDDMDHRGGVAAVTDVVPVGEIFRSGRPLRRNDQVCRADQTWVWDDVVFQILAPIDDVVNSRNDRSCVLRIQSATGSVLLTGDIGHRAERMLVKRYAERLRSDVIVVPHHGAKTSSSRLFLEAVQPQIAIVSRGSGNRYGHPHQSVIARYDDMQALWLDTAKDGAVRVELTGKSMAWRTWRASRLRYWHQRDVDRVR